MKTVFVYASLERKEGGYYNKYEYGPFYHPCGEWVNIMQADSVGMSVHNPNVPWGEYELAIVFSHSDSAGSASFIRKKNSKIKIVTLPEFPPSWHTQKQNWGWSTRMRDDFDASNLIITGQEMVRNEVIKFFNLDEKKVKWIPLPINIPEYKKFTNLEDRKKILAMSCHCNYVESGLRSWRIISEAKEKLPSLKNYRTRVFYGIKEQWINIGNPDEILDFLWDTSAHLKRLNECSIIVDDNICPASGHICVESACLGIPSVGSNDYIAHLFPSLYTPHSYSVERTSEEVDSICNTVNRLANDVDFYKQMVAEGERNLYIVHSYESCKKKLMEALEHV